MILTAQNVLGFLESLSKPPCCGERRGVIWKLPKTFPGPRGEKSTCLCVAWKALHNPAFAHLARLHHFVFSNIELPVGPSQSPSSSSCFLECTSFPFSLVSLTKLNLVSSPLYLSNSKIPSSVMVIEIVLAVFGQMIELGLKSYAPIRVGVASPSGRF